MDAGLQAINNYRTPGGRIPVADPYGNSGMSGYGVPQSITAEQSYNINPAVRQVGGGMKSGAVVYNNSDKRTRTSSLSSMLTTLSRGKHRGVDDLGAKKGDSDDEEEVLLPQINDTIVTYDDISGLRNNGGHKYGYGGAMDDTTPIIPTVITKEEHRNVSNTAYRKLMVSQKKSAMSMLGRDNRQPMEPLNEGRAMSLQTQGYRSQQRVGLPGGLHPHPGVHAVQQYGSSRSQSMMTGNAEHPRQRMREYASPPGSGGAGPKAMSLTAQSTYARNLGQPAFAGPPHSAGAATSPPQSYSALKMSEYMPYQADRFGQNPRTMSLQNQYPGRHPGFVSQPGYQGHVGHSVTPGHPGHPGHLGHPGHPSHPSHPSHLGHPGHPSHPSLQGHPVHPVHPVHPGHQGHQGRQAYPSGNLMTVPVSGPGGTTIGMQMATPARFQQQQVLQPQQTPQSQQTQQTQQVQHAFSQPTTKIGYAKGNENYMNGSNADPGGMHRETVNGKGPGGLAKSEIGDHTKSTSALAPVKVNVLKLSAQKQQEIQVATRELEQKRKEQEQREREQILYANSVRELGKSSKSEEEIQSTSGQDAVDAKAAPSSDVSDIDLSPADILVNGLNSLDTNDPQDMCILDKDFVDDELLGGATSATQVSSASNVMSKERPSSTESAASTMQKNENESTPTMRCSMSSKDDVQATVPILSSIQPPLSSEKSKEGSVSTEMSPDVVQDGSVSNSNKERGFMKAKKFLKKLSRGYKEGESPEPSLIPAEVSNNEKVSYDNSGRRYTVATSFRSFKASDDYPDTLDKRRSMITAVSDNKLSPLPKRRSFHSLFSTPSSFHLYQVRAGNTASSAAIGVDAADDTPQERDEDEFATLGATDKQDSSTTENDDEVAADPAIDNNPASTERDKSSTGATTAYEEDEFHFDQELFSDLYLPYFAQELEELEPPAVVAADRPKHKFKTIHINPAQLSIINSNKALMNDLHLLSQELAESIVRESHLEQKFLSTQSEEEARALSQVDIEIELRKKSSKIVELIQTLNDERLKRFIAEEQLLLAENNAKPSNLDLVYKISQMEKELQKKNNEINLLKARQSQK
ncbi:HFL084Cp [Eremothecium sinecaudum]|uniref:HFL084Cp n=1 Tax=Eremothecium sinecaudum TaxID=45286 RepID=A0A0X8HUH0_9SACH|nr:HFL084Cp [Eremothecium sinecaudum]AMD21772.1 HFL084Cp [Eremothecium sinecaudum]